MVYFKNFVNKFKAYRGLGSTERNWCESLVAASKTLRLHFLEDCHCYCWFHLPCVVGWDGVRMDIEGLVRDLICKVRGHHRPETLLPGKDTKYCVTCGLVGID